MLFETGYLCRLQQSCLQMRHTVNTSRTAIIANELLSYVSSDTIPGVLFTLQLESKLSLIRTKNEARKSAEIE